MRNLKTYENHKKLVKIYFAHPINTYGTDIEIEAINTITYFLNYKVKNEFGSDTKIEIVNPGSNKLQSEFSKYREENPNDYMPYFKNLVRECAYFVYLPFEDQKIGAGIGYEAIVAHNNNIPIYRISFSSQNITDTSIKFIKDRLLSVEETRERIKDKPDDTYLFNLYLSVENFEKAEELLDNGNVDMDKKLHSSSPFTILCNYIDEDKCHEDKIYNFFEKMVDKGVDITEHNNVPYWQVLQLSDPRYIKKLLESGADPNQVFDYKETPLHISFDDGNTDVVKELLKAGAKMTKDNNGNYPFEYDDSFELGSDQILLDNFD